MCNPAPLRSYPFAQPFHPSDQFRLTHTAAPKCQQYSPYERCGHYHRNIIDLAQDFEAYRAQQSYTLILQRKLLRQLIEPALLLIDELAQRPRLVKSNIYTTEFQRED
jgi:hypothetical protein